MNILNRFFKKPIPTIPQERYTATIKPGLTLFELNLLSNELKPVKPPHIRGNLYLLERKENCVYETALNIETAKNKFTKGLEKAQQKLNSQI